MNIPEDIMVQVLIRLPPESLIRSKGVSKSWNLLISSPEFIRLHLQYQKKSTTAAAFRLMRRGFDTYLAKYSLRGGEIGCEIERIYTSVHDLKVVKSILVGSCNGLLCRILTNQVFTSYNKGGYICDISLCNPLTNSSSGLLPKSPLFLQHPRHVVFSGFGYDDVHDTYKIFLATKRVFTLEYLHLAKLYTYDYQVYCLRSNHWITVTFDHDSDLIDNYYVVPDNQVNFSGVLLNCALHWIFIRRGRPPPNQTQTTKDSIIAFDLRAHKFMFFQLPVPVIGSDKYYDKLGVLNGCLFLCQNIRRGGMSGDRSFDMWVMNDYGLTDSWMRMRVCISSPYYDIACITPVAFLEDDNHHPAKINFIYHHGSLLVCYDTISRLITRKFPAPSIDGMYAINGFYAFDGFIKTNLHFVPSLVDPHPHTIPDPSLVDPHDPTSC